MQATLQRWKRRHGFAVAANLSLLFVLLTMLGGDLGPAREAIADEAVVELFAEVSELPGGHGDNLDGDAEAAALAGFEPGFVAPLRSHLLRACRRPAHRYAWRTPAARAPPTLA